MSELRTQNSPNGLLTAAWKPFKIEAPESFQSASRLFGSRLIAKTLGWQDAVETQARRGERFNWNGEGK